MGDLREDGGDGTIFPRFGDGPCYPPPFPSPLPPIPPSLLPLPLPPPSLPPPSPSPSHLSHYMIFQSETWQKFDFILVNRMLIKT